MNTQRFIVLLLAFCLLLVFVLGWYLRRSEVAPPVHEAGTPSPAPQPTQTTPPEAEARVEHRLAGTVVGDEQYVIIEHPDGRNELYRPGQSVPGLGRVAEIGADSAAFDADGRRVTLRLLPAPTPTAGTPGSATGEVEATSPPKPTARPRAPSAPGSSPSADSDRSAS
jgi:hypothetical protein